ncbi:peptidoglycan-binding domain-containing protein [Methyloligella sp. 2.7D]|uniref:peptidoglycan-binding domain-containing protein n=1 Tax=unclassified Methyloligella TaxID=2625955 RepID=UPI00157C8C60|nr:peptidoglycan-binding domain-containing protein [Methyloligella sp. GL2]QKP77175.1 peptidoglycan-binding protein [Methyloligella sp. GL2]
MFGYASLRAFGLIAGLILCLTGVALADEAKQPALSDNTASTEKTESEFERLTRLARASDPACETPWSYSRGLGRCICIREGFGMQWGQCLPMPRAAAADIEATASIPLPERAPDVPEDPATRMERTAAAQDCLAKLGFYKGAVDGEAGRSTVRAFRRFAKRQGLAEGTDLLSRGAQEKLGAACDEKTAALPERRPKTAE